MQWHPDKWSRSSPAHLREAKMRFQQIQEAYSTLSDTRKRMLYDAGLHHLVEDDEVEGFGDFLQEMVTLINDVRKQLQRNTPAMRKLYSIVAANWLDYTYVFITKAMAFCE